MTPPDDLPQTDLGPYRLESLLGRGGMGAVYQAMDERLGRRVAVKHLSEPMAVDERRRRRFRRESQVLARLSHPAIIQIFDLLETEDGDWIVMELVPGSTLAERVRESPLPWREVYDVGRQLAEGLAEAHDQGVLHRDLKSENVMLQGSGPTLRAKILDFGLAKLLGEDPEGTLSHTGQILGTYGSMSPEQAQGEALDARSDLFSFGVVLYEMSAGQRPFRGNSGVEILQKVVSRRHEPLTQWRPEAPPRLVDLIDRLLEKSPEHRPESARWVAEELAETGRQPEPPHRGNQSLAGLRTTLDAEPPVGAGDMPSALRLLPARRILLVALFAVLVAVFVAVEIWRRGAEPDIPEPEGSSMVSQAIEDSTTKEPDPYALFQQGMTDLERFDKPGRLDDAIAAFEAALAEDPESAPAHAGLALAYWRRFLLDRDPLRLEQALPVAQRAVGLDEHLALARIALGTIYAEAGRTEEALVELDAAALLTPENARVEHGRAVAHRSAGDIPAAIAAFERGVELNPEDRFLRDELGALYYRQGRYGEAEEQFSKSIELAPDGVYGYRNLSAVYHAQGRLPEASEALQQALAIKPEHSLYSNLGTILFAQGLYQPAAKAFEKALGQDGANYYLYWANLADALSLANGSEEEAQAAYAQAIRLLRLALDQQPENHLLQSRLLLYLAKSGECAEALAGLKDFDPGQEARDRFRSALAYEACGERKAALEALAEALRTGLSGREIAQEPELFDLRADPRYHSLISGITR